MKINTGVAAVLFIIMVTFSITGEAQSVPELINYQGRLMDGDGAPLADGTTVDITFKFYGVESGDTALYLTVLQEDVVVAGGLYHVLIGSGTVTAGIESGLSAVFLNHAEVWLGVQVDADPEMIPRSRISTAPYAVRAEHCATSDVSLGVDAAALRELDVDGDGHYKPSSSNTPNDDCNDDCPSCYPGAIEVCGDFLDNDCMNGECSPVASLTGGHAYGLHVVGDYAYLANYDYGLIIVDVSSPSMPTLAGTYNTPGYAWDVHVSGNYAYVADYLDGLQIIDVSNPSSPVLVGTYDTAGRAYGVFVEGSYAYVADFFDGLKIIDVSTPSAPTLAAGYNTSGNSFDVMVVGNYAYVADAGSGLIIFNVSTPSSPSYAGAYNTSGSAYAVYVSGNYAYVADGTGGLMVIYVANPSSPSLHGAYNTPGNAMGVWLSGSHAYVGDSNDGGLQIIDVSNPYGPVLAGVWDTGDYTQGVQVKDGLVYLANGYSGLGIVQTLTNY